ncbi:hypothetical protein CSW98_01990 [Vibrio sp. HA2012]|uniref:hypothetical protein n=1 Tax=Vibrio sp. HA2012 TaxID=1971595 RepID=UPI000CC0F87C|nr:hypothetical protein [Vibrio sp. HA2012]PJC87916.1 hypothetical protein CSW98_01990 [Vibrio sp. HA2012]
MTRLFAIGVLIALAVLLFRYRTNEKIQTGVIIALITGIMLYTIIIVISELIR